MAKGKRGAEASKQRAVKKAAKLAAMSRNGGMSDYAIRVSARRRADGRDAVSKGEKLPMPLPLMEGYHRDYWPKAHIPFDERVLRPQDVKITARFKAKYGRERGNRKYS